MTGRQYNRTVRLRVGNSTTLEKEYTGMRIAFRIEKTAESTPNTASISIFNLGENSRGRFETKDAVCTLEAGYDGSIELIFTGIISRAATTISGIDTITEVECGDGEKAFREAVIDKSFPPGANAQQVIKSLTDEMFSVVDGGIKTIKNLGADLFKSFGNGFSLSGAVASSLDTVTKSIGADWSIQDGELEIIPIDKSNGENAILVSPETGLIGSPAKLKQKEGEKEQPGVTFEVLLQPRLRPGRLVKIESRTITGLYVLKKVTHEGDSQGGVWLTKCEGVIPK